MEDALIACSYCSKDQNACSKIVAGSQQYICDQCVFSAVDELLKGQRQDPVAALCPFGCNKSAMPIWRPTDSSKPGVCYDCLQLCLEIIAEASEDEVASAELAELKKFNDRFRESLLSRIR
jgi:ATP-dependent protease Clp ATPase subunit